MEINEKEYWENRFEEDWENMQGDKQSIFFSNVMIQLLPEWIKKEVIENQYDICDVGCALGDGTNVLSDYFNIPLTGFDFSENAIEKATVSYPSLIFKNFDVRNKDVNTKKFDIVLSSNVLEHFKNPWEVFKNLVFMSKKYIILLVPFEEEMQVDEHEYKFNPNNIRISIDGFNLIYAKSVDCSKMENTYYADMQILLIYSNDSNSSYSLQMISNILTKNKIKKDENTKKYITNLKNRINDLENNVISKLKNEINELENIKIVSLNKIYDLEGKLDSNKKEYEDYVSSSLNKIQKLESIIRKLENTNQEQEDNYNLLIEQKKVEIEFLNSQIFNMNRSLSWKLTYPLRKLGNCTGFSKLHYKFLENKSDCFVFFKRSKIYSVIKEFLPEKLKYKIKQKVNLKTTENTIQEKDILLEMSHFASLSKKGKFLLVFSGVKFIDSEGQRNIRLVSEAIKKKFKVIYVYWRWDSNEEFEKSTRDMFQIPLDLFYLNKERIFSEMLNEIKNKWLLIEFPHNYIFEILNIANCFGWKSMYDVIDDWEEFSKKGQAVWYDKKTEIAIAKNADIRVYTAEILRLKINKLINYSNFSYVVPNGVNPDRMRKSIKLQEYDFSKGDLQIGYFGHLTDAWFDWELIEQIAKERKNWTIHLIGYGEPKDLKLPKNIILYGKKEPSELPKYAAYWDVAIIPFINCELTKAVNPIKVFEYLQLHLPTVASNMPEIQFYPYVQLAIGSTEFIEAIEKASCQKVNNKIISEFIKKNTWEQRFKDIDKIFESFQFEETYKIIYK